MNGRLSGVKWYGKSFDSLMDVKPLMCRDADGDLYFKKVDGATLMGIMNGKGVLDQGRHFYFVLDRA